MYNDKQVGDSCYLDGDDTYRHWHADLIDMPVIIPGGITANYGDFSGRIVKYSSEAAFSFYVYGDTADECERNTAGLIATAKQATVISTSKSLLEYAGTLINVTSEAAFTDWDDNNFYNTVTLTFAAVQRGKLQTLSIPAPGEWVAVKGTSAAPCRIILEHQLSIDSVEILGVTINNLTAGEVFLVDGIDGKFTDFSRVKLIDLPTLAVGKTYLNLSTTVDGRLEYYPIY